MRSGSWGLGGVAFVCLSLGAVAYAGEASDAVASDHAGEATSSPWRIVTGGSFAIFDSRAAWTPQGLAGAVVQLEETLGLAEDIETWLVGGSYRFNRRHLVEVRMTDLSRSAVEVLDEELEWGDVVYRADGRVESRFGFTSVQGRWCYDFSETDRLAAGVSAGLSTFIVSLRLEGEGRLESGGEEEWVDGLVEEADVLAPVPVVGVFLDAALSPRWTLHVDASAMDLDLGEHSGRVLESEASLEYQASPLVGIGLVLAGTDIDYRQTKGGEKLGLDYRVSSLGAYLSFSF